MIDWVRLWHDMPTDPKWRVIARKSGQPLPCVIALFTVMLTAASAADDRGSVAGMSVEDAAAALDMDEEAVSAILVAMDGRVIEGGRLSGWERRQPKREDNSTERVKAFRERKSSPVQRNETQLKRDETQTKHNGTVDKEEEKEEEKERSKQASSARAGELCKRIVESYERHGCFPIPDTGKVHVWLAQGHDPGIIAAVIDEGCARVKSAKPLSYWEKPITEAHARKVVPVVKREGHSTETWEAALSVFFRSPPHNRTWMQVLGPDPDSGRCRAPPDLLKKHGLASAAVQDLQFVSVGSADMPRLREKVQ